MNDTDIETRLREQLPRLADFAVGASEPTTPLADVQVLAPARRPRWRIVAAAGVAAALVVGGVVIVDALRSPAGRRTPIGVSSEPVVETLTIVAYNFHFDRTVYYVPAGVTDIHFASNEGSHTLEFADPKLGDVHLVAANATIGGTDASSATADACVVLEADHTYEIFCVLPGHRAAGMEARIVVGQTRRPPFPAP